MTPTQLPDPLLHSLPPFKNQSPTTPTLLGSVLLLQPLMSFCKMGLYHRPLGDILAVSFPHGAFKTEQQENLLASN